jgi:hypothetical protein
MTANSRGAVAETALQIAMDAGIAALIFARPARTLGRVGHLPQQ